MSQFVAEMTCVTCGKSLGPTETRMTCPSCGPHEGILDICYDLDRVKAAQRVEPLGARPLTHWRYRELLPVAHEYIPHDWPVGWTPIVDAKRLAAELGISQLFFKDEGRNPTASFKDRASSVGVAHAIQRGMKTIGCASTGNAATSLAGHAALAGLPAVIFVPQTAPEPKLAQLLVYGATVVAIDGTYDEAYRLCSQACDRFGWYNRNCAINPVLVKGKKTAGLEIAEQCAELGGVPDWVAVSIGDGCTIAGIWKGLFEMHMLGVIDRLPRLLGVQAAQVAPVHHALQHGALPEPGQGRTIADSIDVQVPRNWRKAVRALRESNGVTVCVSDQQILHAIRVAGQHGMFAEPAAAAALAGVLSSVDASTIRPQERILVMVTGSGLKDTRSAVRAGGEPIRIEPDLDVLANALAARQNDQGR